MPLYRGSHSCAIYSPPSLQSGAWSLWEAELFFTGLSPICVQHLPHVAWLSLSQLAWPPCWISSGQAGKPSIFKKGVHTVFGFYGLTGSSSCSISMAMISSKYLEGTVNLSQWRIQCLDFCFSLCFHEPICKLNSASVSDSTFHKCTHI